MEIVKLGSVTAEILMTLSSQWWEGGGGGWCKVFFVSTPTVFGNRMRIGFVFYVLCPLSRVCPWPDHVSIIRTDAPPTVQYYYEK